MRILAVLITALPLFFLGAAEAAAQSPSDNTLFDDPEFGLFVGEEDYDFGLGGDDDGPSFEDDLSTIFDLNEELPPSELLRTPASPWTAEEAGESRDDEPPLTDAPAPDAAAETAQASEPAAEISTPAIAEIPAPAAAPDPNPELRLPPALAGFLERALEVSPDQGYDGPLVILPSPAPAPPRTRKTKPVEIPSPTPTRSQRSVSTPALPPVSISGPGALPPEPVSAPEPAEASPVPDGSSLAPAAEVGPPLEPRVARATPAEESPAAGPTAVSRAGDDPGDSILARVRDVLLTPAQASAQDGDRPAVPSLRKDRGLVKVEALKKTPGSRAAAAEVASALELALGLSGAGEALAESYFEPPVLAVPKVTAEAVPDLEPVPALPKAAAEAAPGPEKARALEKLPAKPEASAALEAALGLAGAVPAELPGEMTAVPEKIPAGEKPPVQAARESAPAARKVLPEPQAAPALDLALGLPADAPEKTVPAKVSAGTPGEAAPPPGQRGSGNRGLN